EWLDMSVHGRQVFLARHPGAAARYFDCVITNFIEIILKYSPCPTDPGVFGLCNGYYAMVEAQGRGTLHCHMLVWIIGNPSPQALRDSIAGDPAFKTSVFAWLESIIKCELPGMTEPRVENTPDDANKPKWPAGWVNPQYSRGPDIDSLGRDEFDDAFQKTVTDLAIECNWHEHRATCWKHLKPGQPRNDTSCRMRIDGTTRGHTSIDEETQSIMLRRLHPRINNYNEVVLFLLRCNIDIKYIGSGEAAKALVFYITDYITKSTLPAHVGLAAVEYAIKKNEEKFAGLEQPTHPTALDHAVGTVVDQDKSLFTKTVMAIMSRQELSHQQVMSYLVGGGDTYHSHTFSTIRWGDFDRHVATWEQRDKAPPESGQMDYMLVRVDELGISIASDVADYRFRPAEEEFDLLSMWEHSEWVIKISKASEEKRLNGNTSADVNVAGPTTKRKRGKRANSRGQLLSSHPSAKTHLARLRSTPVVPVLLGSPLPRPDRGEAELEKWCRSMLVLFKPWRHASDLLGEHRTWKEAFHACDFSPAVTAVMKNLNVENECQDARDEHDKLRRAGKGTSLLAGALLEFEKVDADSLHTALVNDPLLDVDD
ncbi:hypothetical protein R3P38DRAFT_2416132, partial [Favolaschia claudopus]